MRGPLKEHQYHFNSLGLQHCKIIYEMYRRYYFTIKYPFLTIFWESRREFAEIKTTELY